MTFIIKRAPLKYGHFTILLRYKHNIQIFLTFVNKNLKKKPNKQINKKNNNEINFKPSSLLLTALARFLLLFHSLI